MTTRFFASTVLWIYISVLVFGSAPVIADDEGSSCDSIPSSSPYTQAMFDSALQSFEECTFRHRDMLRTANKEAAILKTNFDTTSQAVQASTAAYQQSNDVATLKAAKQKELADLEALKTQAQSIQDKYKISSTLAKRAQEQGDFLYQEAQKLDRNASNAIQVKHNQALRNEEGALAMFKANAIYAVDLKVPTNNRPAGYPFQQYAERAQPVDFFQTNTDAELTKVAATAQETLNKYVASVEQTDAKPETTTEATTAPTDKPETAAKTEPSSAAPAPSSSPAPAPSAAPAPAAATAAAPAAAPAASPTPSFQKKSSMPGWVLPVAALAVGGVGGYLVGKSAAKSSSDSSSGTKSTASSSGSDTKSSSGESASTTASASGSSDTKTTASAAVAQPATQETQQIAAVEVVPQVTPVQEVSTTNDTRRVTASSSGSAKKSWKGLKCPEVTPVESYNPVVLNSSKAMTDLRNQCLAEGGRP